MNTVLDHSKSNDLRAAGSMVLAMVIIGIIDNYIVVLSEHIGLWQFQVARSVIAVALIALMSAAGLGTLKPRRLWAVAARSAFITLAMLFYFGALAFLPFAQAVAGLFTSPVFVLLITAFLLRRPIGPWRILAVAIGFTGILFVLNPQAGHLSWSMIMPVVGGLFYAMGAIATRELCEGESTMCLLNGIIVMQAIFGGVALMVLTMVAPDVPDGSAGFLVRGWIWPFWEVMHLVLLQAVGSVAGVALIILAYQLGTASQVAVLEYSALVFGPFFAWILLGQVISMWQAFGIAMIACAGIIVALRSGRNNGA
ncbi:MAG: DMT family transporter [Paracoccaceae bacterium]